MSRTRRFLREVRNVVLVVALGLVLLAAAVGAVILAAGTATR
ncbi:MAG TPA: hypothetical protein VGI06_03415 [Acidimicrobiales bacterium]